MSVLRHESYHSYLVDEFKRRKGENSRFSLRMYARVLGVSPGELSELLSGKRMLTLRSASKIAATLRMSEPETSHLFYLVQRERGDQVVKPPTTESRQLSLDLFEVVSTWYSLAIVNLADTADFRLSPNWIAQRLGISRTEVSWALHRLRRIGLIEKDKNGHEKITDDYVLSPEGIPSEAIRSYHRQMLAKAQEALDTQTPDERWVNGAGFAIDPKKLPMISKEVQAFVDGIVQKYSVDEAPHRRKEVYQMEVELFRLTQRKEEK